MQGLFTVLNLMDVFPLSVLIPEDLSVNEAWAQLQNYQEKCKKEKSQITGLQK